MIPVNVVQIPKLPYQHIIISQGAEQVSKTIVARSSIILQIHIEENKYVCNFHIKLQVASEGIDSLFSSLLKAISYFQYYASDIW